VGENARTRGLLFSNRVLDGKGDLFVKMHFNIHVQLTFATERYRFLLKVSWVKS